MRSLLFPALLAVLSLLTLSCSVIADVTFPIVTQFNTPKIIGSIAVTSTSVYWLPSPLVQDVLFVNNLTTGAALPTINIAASVAGRGYRTPLWPYAVRSDSAGFIHCVEWQNRLILKLTGNGTLISAVQATNRTLSFNFDVSPDGSRYFIAYPSVAPTGAAGADVIELHSTTAGVNSSLLSTFSMVGGSVTSFAFYSTHSFYTVNTSLDREVNPTKQVLSCDYHSSIECTVVVPALPVYYYAWNFSAVTSVVAVAPNTLALTATLFSATSSLPLLCLYSMQPSNVSANALECQQGARPGQNHGPTMLTLDTQGHVVGAGAQEVLIYDVLPRTSSTAGGASASSASSTSMSAVTSATGSTTSTPLVPTSAPSAATAMPVTPTSASSLSAGPTGSGSSSVPAPMPVNEGESHGVSSEVVVGIVLGVLALVVVMVMLGWYGRRECGKAGDSRDSASLEAPMLSKGW